MSDEPEADPIDGAVHVECPDCGARLTTDGKVPVTMRHCTDGSHVVVLDLAMRASS